MISASTALNKDMRHVNDADRAEGYQTLTAEGEPEVLEPSSFEDADDFLNSEGPTNEELFVEETSEVDSSESFDEDF